MHETNVFRDVPRRTLLLTTTLGIALGIGWVLLTGAIVARSYGVPLGAGIAAGRIAREGLGIPLGSMLLMLVPVVVVRLLRPPTRESMDGFMIGALGALAFTAAATLTRLAPQFATGIVARARPVSSLIVEAGIRGIAVPLTAACVGGLIGAALWFTRPPNKAHQHANYVRIALAGFAAAVLAVYAALGLIDVAHIPQFVQLAIHLTVAAVSLLLLRLGLHLALLHEEHDEIQSDEPVLCPNCNHVVPDMAFCPACGVATHASSRFSREERRQTRPTRAGADEPTTEATHPGYSTTAGVYTAPPLHRTSYLRLLRTWGVAIVVVALALVGLSVIIHKPPARYICPPDCGHPPTGEPVAVNPRFTAPDGTFSVSHPAPSQAYRITTSPTGVRADFLAGDGGTMQLMSRPANGRSAEQIANDLVQRDLSGYQDRVRDPQCDGRLRARLWAGRRLLAAGRQQQLHADAGDRHGRGEERPRFDRRGRRPVPAVRPGLRARQALRGEPAVGAGHGQIRQQLQLARRSSALTIANVDIDKCHHSLLYSGMVEIKRAARGSVQSRAAAALSKRTIRPLTAVMPVERAWGLWLARQILARLMDAFGPTLSDTHVERVDTTLRDGRRLVGEWVTADGVSRGDAAIYYIHGSGYALCSPRTHRRLTAWLSRLTGLPVFVVDYRLAPRHRFPTAADDVRAGWDWLLQQGIGAERMVIAGDSAGGHLAVDLALQPGRAATRGHGVAVAAVRPDVRAGARPRGVAPRSGDARPRRRSASSGCTAREPISPIRG